MTSSLATRKTGKKVAVTHTPISTLEEKLRKNPHDSISSSMISLDKGEGVVGDVTDNNLWPDWNAKMVLELIA